MSFLQPNWRPWANSLIVILNPASRLAQQLLRYYYSTIPQIFMSCIRSSAPFSYQRTFSSLRYVFVCQMQSLSIDRLSTVVASVKTFYISMRSFNLDKVVVLLRLFPCLDNLFLGVVISNTALKAHTFCTSTKY